MTPGPDEITRCPKCHALHRCWSHGSGNMMGAVVWTDGRVVAPFSAVDRCVTRCPHCGEVFLRSAACVVGMLRPAWSRGRCDVRVTLQVVPSAARVDVMRLCREVFGDAPDLARRPDAFTLRALAQQGIERLSILAVFA